MHIIHTELEILKFNTDLSFPLQEIYPAERYVYECFGRGGVVTVTVYNSNKRDRTSVPTSRVEPAIKSKEVY